MQFEPHCGGGGLQSAGHRPPRLASLCCANVLPPASRVYVFEDVGAAAERRRHEELDGGREALHARHARDHQRPVVAGEPQPDRYLRLLDLPHRSRGSVGQPRRVSWVLRTIVLVKNCMNIDQLSERTVRRRSAAFAASSGAAAAAARAPSGESESADAIGAAIARQKPHSQSRSVPTTVDCQARANTRC